MKHLTHSQFRPPTLGLYGRFVEGPPRRSRRGALVRIRGSLMCASRVIRSLRVPLRVIAPCRFLGDSQSCSPTTAVGAALLTSLP